jgi:hypothetical protein
MSDGVHEVAGCSAGTPAEDLAPGQIIDKPSNRLVFSY